MDDLAKVSFKLPPDVLRPAADAQRAQTAAAARAHDSAAQQAGSAAGKSISPSHDAFFIMGVLGNACMRYPCQQLVTLPVQPGLLKHSSHQVVLRVCSAGSRVDIRSPRHLRSPSAQGAHGILKPYSVLQPWKTPSRQRPRMLTGQHWQARGLKASSTQLRQVRGPLQQHHRARIPCCMLGMHPSCGEVRR